MLSSRPSRWILALACGALFAAGCSTTTDTPQGETGSLSVDLVLADGIEIDEVGWQITGNDMDMSGTIDVSAPGSTASVEVFGLPPGDTDYTVMLTATTTDEEVTCQGSAPFNVEVGQSTNVMVMLNCKKPRTLGGVRVNGKFNICTELTKAVVSPLQTSVGNDISLSAQASDEEGDAIHYIWTGEGGSIADPSAASTTYTCQEVGDHTVMIMVTDNDVYCRMATWTIPVTCVEGDGGDLCEDVECEDDGNECTEAACNPANGACETSNVADGTECNGGAGACSAGQCVDDNLCEGVDCDDQNECTADACNPADGSCDNTNVDNGTPCNNDEGMCSDGSCVDVNLCDGVVCDDTGNDCTVAMCNNATGECDTMNVTDGTECNGGTGACSAGECIDPDIICDEGVCATDDEKKALCVAAVLACLEDEVNVGECILGAVLICEPADPCDGLDCSDGLECTDDVCTDGVCSNPPVTDGTMCDSDMGVCDMGVCEPANLCEGVDCSDGNECTQDLCNAATGICSNPDETDGTECTCPVCGAEGLCMMGECVDPCDGVDCSDGNQCTADLCTVGVCSNPNLGPGAACDQDGGVVCDGSGNCVAGCTVPAPVDAVGIPMACRNSFNQAVSTFPIDLLNVTASDCVLAGDPVDFAMDPTIALDTAFLDAAAQTLCDLGTTLTEADVTFAQVSVDSVAGATCTEQLSVLQGTPVTVTIETVCDGACGDTGVICEVAAGIVLPLPPITVPCTAGAADSEVQLCSTGTVPLSISLTDPMPPPSYTQTYVGVDVGGGQIRVAFACNTSSTTNPAPGQENEIGCVLGNPTPSTPSGQSCAEAVGDGNVGETPFPTSDCNTEDGPPVTPQTCDLFGNPTPCSGTCDTVPVAVDPSTVCATFPVE